MGPCPPGRDGADEEFYSVLVDALEAVEVVFGLGVDGAAGVAEAPASLVDALSLEDAVESLFGLVAFDPRESVL
jgi:hypothetical protein